MLDKFKKVEDRYKELENLLADPKTIEDQHSYQKYAKEFSTITPMVEIARIHQTTVQQISELEHMLKEKHEKDFEELARIELTDLKKKKEDLELRFEDLANPKV